MLKMMYILIVLEYKFFKYNYDTTLISFSLEHFMLNTQSKGKQKIFIRWSTLMQELQVS